MSNRGFKYPRLKRSEIIQGVDRSYDGTCNIYELLINSKLFILQMKRTVKWGRSKRHIEDKWKITTERFSYIVSHSTRLSYGL